MSIAGKRSWNAMATVAASITIRDEILRSMIVQRGLSGKSDSEA